MSCFQRKSARGERAHARFYDARTREQIPKCRYGKYTIITIINSIVGNGFALERVDGRPAWENENLPDEFTKVAIEQDRRN